MSKVKFSALLGAAAILLGATMTGPSVAGGLAIGIQGTAIYIETSATETLKTTSVVTSTEDGQVGAVPGAFIQYTFGDDGFVIGIEKIPGEVNVVNKTRLIRDAREAYDDATEYTAPEVKQIVKADVQDHISVFVETPGFGPAGFHLKLGYSEVTIETSETLGTGAVYGNADINGYTVGAGFKGVADNGMLMKVAAEYTDYDTATFNSTGSDAVTKITADPETYALKISLGYQF